MVSATARHELFWIGLAVALRAHQRVEQSVCVIGPFWRPLLVTEAPCRLGGMDLAPTRHNCHPR
jgi:hypothetical protein